MKVVCFAKQKERLTKKYSLVFYIVKNSYGKIGYATASFFI